MSLTILHEDFLKITNTNNDLKIASGTSIKTNSKTIFQTLKASSYETFSIFLGRLIT